MCTNIFGWKYKCVYCTISICLVTDIAISCLQNAFFSNSFIILFSFTFINVSYILFLFSFWHFLVLVFANVNHTEYQYLLVYQSGSAWGTVAMIEEMLLKLTSLKVPEDEEAYNVAADVHSASDSGAQQFLPCCNRMNCTMNVTFSR